MVAPQTRTLKCHAWQTGPGSTPPTAHASTAYRELQAAASAVVGAGICSEGKPKFVQVPLSSDMATQTDATSTDLVVFVRVVAD